ncbi:hypothetical protein PsorP6_001564 [Peronosclerospora sorghi]|uniref:Uncharacterized protein n=1 Tax=Peronosclerospora sorghi TaxID=230839 RepID=A0ACC0WS83_9STRA|nr:hypothetical protein PsorP6_001564 [Peronosclerospora sorghi]
MCDSSPPTLSHVIVPSTSIGVMSARECPVFRLLAALDARHGLLVRMPPSELSSSESNADDEAEEEDDDDDK